MTVESDIIGDSDALRECVDYADTVAQSDAAVLILGESGVGKELIAQRIHNRSPRANGELVSINCASIPRELFESEFFGHVKGSFTGATRDRRGRFEDANNGTLFLDEVGEMPPELQGKLLRALQQQTFERLGDDRTRHVDVRVIAATNRPLTVDVNGSRFRRDLYYRLSTFLIEVPPLRERAEDVLPLTEAFIDRLGRKYRRTAAKLTQRNRDMLMSYDWPGNVRELKSVVERAFVLGRSSGRLDFDRAFAGSRAISVAGRTKALEHGKRRGYMTAQEFAELQKNNLIAVMEATQWRISGDGGAAELLGVKPTTLTSQLKAHEIARPKKNSIYRQLGGEKTIAAIARDLLGRLQGDPQVGRFWISRSNLGLHREERMLTSYLCAALGGPQSYSGETMTEAHKGLGITLSDWNVFHRHVDATLQAFDVHPILESQLKSLIEGLKSQIVVDQPALASKSRLPA